MTAADDRTAAEEGSKPMSAATDYLAHWIQAAANRPPGMTRVTAERSRSRLPSDRNPGIASYGLGVNGMVLKDSADRGIGLKFSTVYTWSVDRSLDPANIGAVGAVGRFSSEAQFEFEEHTLQITGDAVELTVQSLSKPFGFSVSTRNVDHDQKQLVFSLPSAGRAVPQTRLVLSLVGSGEVRCGAPQLHSTGQSRQWCAPSDALAV